MATVSLAAFTQRLNADHGVGLSYNRALDLAIRGDIPATLNTGGTRWTVDLAHLPVVAARLRPGTTSKAAA
jgi:hypothetical protein